MSAISIARAYNPVEIDLWGAKYETIDVPRSGLKKVTKLETEVAGLQSGAIDVPEDSDELDVLVEKIGELLDVKLVAVGGGKSKPSTHIKKKWRADELTLPQLLGFMDEVGEGEGKANRSS